MEPKHRVALVVAALAGVIAFLLIRLPESVAGPPLFVSVMALSWLVIGTPNSGAKRLETRRGQTIFGLISAVLAVALLISAAAGGPAWFVVPGVVLTAAAAIQAVRVRA